MTFIEQILAAIAAVIIAFGIGFGIGHFREKSYMEVQAKVLSQSITAASDLKLAAAAKAKTAVESKLQAQINLDQSAYDTNIGTLSATIAQLRLDNVQLHQPPHRESSHPARHRVAGPAKSSVGPDYTAALSPETTDFLLSFAGDADVVRNRLVTCKAYSDQVESAVNQYNADLKKLSGESTKDVRKSFELPASSSSAP